MKQIVQPVSGGPATLLDTPRPVVTLRFADGSLASIGYGSAVPAQHSEGCQ